MNVPKQEPLPEMWERRIREELEPGEKLIWASQPLGMSAARTALDAWPWMLFGLCWLGFTVFGCYMWQSSRISRKEADADFDKHFQGEFFRDARERRQKQAEGVSMFDVVPLVIAGAAGLVGVALLLSPVWILLSHKQWQAQSCYALTTRRALVWEPGGDGVSLYSYDPSRLKELKRIERDDGSGDLVFEEYTYTYQANVAPAGSQPVYETRQGVGQRGFLNVAQVGQVARLLKQTLQL